MHHAQCSQFHRGRAAKRRSNREPKEVHLQPGGPPKRGGMSDMTLQASFSLSCGCCDHILYCLPLLALSSWAYHPVACLPQPFTCSCLEQTFWCGVDNQPTHPLLPSEKVSSSWTEKKNLSYQLAHPHGSKPVCILLGPPGCRRKRPSISYIACMGTTRLAKLGWEAIYTHIISLLT